MILAGDVGGTTTRLALFKADGKGLTAVVKSDYRSRDYAGLAEIIEAFVSTDAGSIEAGSIEQACFGIAGPVLHGRVATPNLAWMVAAEALAHRLGLPKVALINDLEANVHGIPGLEKNDFEVLNEGSSEAIGNIAVIAAGTGLGEAGGFWDGERHHPFAGEGGHADFAPRTALEADLLRHLIDQFDHVSWERVVSGPGLYNIYRFLRDTKRYEEPAWLAAQLRQNDPPAVISKVALESQCELCVQALHLFVTLYGAEAGNLALKLKATGGVFLGGGIAPKLIRALRAPAFMQAFTAKGRFQGFMEAVPVKIILNDQTALLGAARYAALHAGLV
jgi:glucokinase